VQFVVDEPLMRHTTALTSSESLFDVGGVDSVPGEKSSFTAGDVLFYAGEAKHFHELALVTDPARRESSADER
jgi:hypothetical protein